MVIEKRKSPPFHALEKLVIAAGSITLTSGIAIKLYSENIEAYSNDLILYGGMGIVAGTLSYILRNATDLRLPRE